MARIEKERIQGFDGKTRRKETNRRPRRRWEDNIKMNLRERKWAVWSGFICLMIETSGDLF
jgi:hypothetical protein